MILSKEFKKLRNQELHHLCSSSIFTRMTRPIMEGMRSKEKEAETRQKGNTQFRLTNLILR